MRRQSAPVQAHGRKRAVWQAVKARKFGFARRAGLGWVAAKSGRGKKTVKPLGLLRTKV